MKPPRKEHEAYRIVYIRRILTRGVGVHRGGLFNVYGRGYLVLLVFLALGGDV